jgi:hypothetical protein
MPNELAERLTSTLQDRANLGAPIDPARLMRQAVVDGRRIRTRRRAVTAVLAAVAVGAIVVTGTLAPRPSDSATPAPDPSRSGFAPADLALLPVAAGEPGAGARPDLVATDPQILHFSADSLANQAVLATWTSTGGYESATIERDDFQVYVAVSRDPEKLPPSNSFVKFFRYALSSPTAVTIGGRPGTAATSVGTTRLPGRPQVSSLAGKLWALLWQPVDGLWATVEVQGQSLDRAVQIAESIRFDLAKKCALPFTVGRAPAGTQLLTCSIRFSTQMSRLFAGAQLGFGDGKKTFTFYASDSEGGGVYPRPLKAGANQVWADPHGGNWTMLMDGVFFDVTASPSHAFTQQQALDTLATVRMRAHPEDPSTW